ncbi:MAG TPA: hypothetical protein VLZ72_00815 [Flavobacterium sp.]|nr:hypothetical protein [Flavobacterium sp.]
MKNFFEAIQFLFEDVLLILMDFFRALELENWWSANIINWFFVIICASYLVYWIKQIQIFNQNPDEKQDTTAHSFLK